MSEYYLADCTAIAEYYDITWDFFIAIQVYVLYNSLCYTVSVRLGSVRSAMSSICFSSDWALIDIWLEFKTPYSVYVSIS